MSSVNDQFTKQESRFMKAFGSARATLCAADCQCGRLHFVSAPGHGDYDEGELEKLQQRAKDDPKNYIEHSEFDIIEIAVIGGREYIPQCPCGAVERHANWIDDHAEQLVAYLKEYFAAKLSEQRAEMAAAGTAFDDLDGMRLQPVESKN